MPKTGNEGSHHGLKDPVYLLSASARTASETGGWVMMPPEHTAMMLQLDVTAAATDAGDTLDVKIQILRGDAEVTDVCYFTQVLGNGGAKQYIAKLMSQTAENMYEDTALTAGNIRHLLAMHYRAVATIVDVSTDDASFTFGVTAIPL